MRRRVGDDRLSVHAIAGTEAVLLAVNVSDAAREGLLGFTIAKHEEKGGRQYPLRGGRTFKDVHGDKDVANVIQSFAWSDYVVAPGETYTYTVVPQYGQPGRLQPGRAVAVTVRTEVPDDRVHAVYFNRGGAGSQAYNRRFSRYGRWYLKQPADSGKEAGEYLEPTFLIRPEYVPKRVAYRWLSRGLEEAVLGFIQQATGPQYSLRASVYELTYQPVIHAFVDALERGADVKIVHHAKHETKRHVKRSRGAAGKQAVVEPPPAAARPALENVDVEALLQEKGRPERFQAALLDAFRTPLELQMMLDYKMGVKLYHHVPHNSPDATLVYQLLQWTASEGRLQELLEAACNEKPNNAKLRNFVKSLLPAQPPPPAAQSAAEAKQVIVEEQVPDFVLQTTLDAVGQVGLVNADHLEAFRHMMIQRKNTTISHNNFVVLLKQGKPVQVWTGSTGFTTGAIFGQSNVGHIVRDPKVAQKYFKYWKKLATDPKRKRSKSDDSSDAGMRAWTDKNNPDLTGQTPPNSTVPVFSPRSTKDMLDWYAGRIAAAQNSVFFTATFSVSQPFLKVLAKAKDSGRDEPYLRYVLLESRAGLMQQKYEALSKCPQNWIAWGETLKQREMEGHRLDALTGLNEHVLYLNARFLLIDPLSDDPLVILGSGAFSEASTTRNDENMLIIRGNTRVADIYLTEFMRSFRTFHYRNRANAMSDEQLDQVAHLYPDDSWTEPYFTAGTHEYNERLLFA
jgi:phosphatidylserine/phosphatidylglycerophosphate/cardiolipin synthase-like enzyme